MGARERQRKREREHTGDAIPVLINEGIYPDGSEPPGSVGERVSVCVWVWLALSCTVRLSNACICLIFLSLVRVFYL